MVKKAWDRSREVKFFPDGLGRRVGLEFLWKTTMPGHVSEFSGPHFGDVWGFNHLNIILSFWPSATRSPTMLAVRPAAVFLRDCDAYTGA
jgi:hypothetical protein